MTKVKKEAVSRGPVPCNGKNQLVIALDFGTTYSGVAYCFANQRNTEVVAITNWPGAEGEATPKVPTLINYDVNGDFVWGASVDRTLHNNIVGVKLLLDPSQEQPVYLPSVNMKRTLRVLPKPAVEIAADFLGAIYGHAMTEIAKVVPSEYMSLCEKQFVLSVPAVWSDTAKNATLEAAEMAGIFPVTLIKEPEAAALYTMRSLDFSLREGDAFLVCDAGGGTVDLISYEVAAIRPDLHLKELVPGTGGIGGSLLLNKLFAETFKDLIGEEKEIKIRSTVKRAFRGDPKEEYFVSFPMTSLEDAPKLGIEGSCWKMTGEDCMEIFSPVINRVLGLIDNQLKSAIMKRGGKKITMRATKTIDSFPANRNCHPQGIFLVGGFGSSQYLKARVEVCHPGIQVLQPADAWAAIVKGAAMSGLPSGSKIIATCSTKHYGVQACRPYELADHPGLPIIISEYTGFKMVSAMTWYINIGDDIQRDQKIRFPFYRSIDGDYSSTDLIFTDCLIECSDPYVSASFPACSQARQGELD
ncbi:putative hsp70 protein [Immersiella caudata]|uniref:Hsp70 protein n=1 Tax=Immersiella caudata TaxID=314043 RepID=A0AA40C0X1_9PEZI|nr:putative hsp70 protein [Immersiella caudata]